MSEDTNGKLAKRKAEVEKQFNTAEQERQQLVQQRSNIDRRLGEIVTLQTELRGRYAELEALAQPEMEIGPVMTIPSKKKKKEN